MNRRLIVIGLALTVLSPVSPRGMAQGSAAPAEAPGITTAELLRRLEAAEQRIRELEAQIRPPASTSRDFSAGASNCTKAAEDKNNMGDGVGSPADRIQSLEEADKKRGESLGDLKKELDDVGGRFRWSSSIKNFRLTGRIHLDNILFLDDSPGAGFLEHPLPGSPDFGADPENRLVLRRLRLGFAGDVKDNVFWKLQLEFADTTAQFRDAYLGFKDIAYLGDVLIGNQKRPINMDQLNSSNDNPFMERALIADAFNEESRRIGILAANRNDAETITWQYGFFNNKITQVSGQYTSDAYQGIGVGRVTHLVFYDEAQNGRNYLHLGLAASVAGYDGDANAADGEPNLARFRARPEIRTVNRFYNTGRIAGADYGYQQAAEFLLNLGPLGIGAEHELDEITRTGNQQDVFLHGGYVYINYFLTGEHQEYNRKLGKLNGVSPFENFFLVERLCGRVGGGWGAIALGARYSYIDLTDRDISGGVGNQFTLGLNWWWNQNSRLMINYVYGNIIDFGPIGGFTDANFSALSTRFQVNW